MLWKLNYIVDTGYEWEKRVCIIKAENKEQALSLLHTEIETKLPGESFVLNKYTEISEYNKSPILYDGIR